MARSNVCLRSDQATTKRFQGKTLAEKCVSMVSKLLLFNLQLFLSFHVPRCFRTPQSQPFACLIIARFKVTPLSLIVKSFIYCRLKTQPSRDASGSSKVVQVKEMKSATIRPPEAFSVARKTTSDTFIWIKVLR